jgi:hypothetical protein
MSTGKKSAEPKSLRSFTAASLLGRAVFYSPGFWCTKLKKRTLTMKTSKLAIRIGANPTHHHWKNNGTW